MSSPAILVKKRWGREKPPRRVYKDVMSLEDRMRRAKRRVKKRDSDLAKKGTSAKDEQIKRNKDIQTRTAAQSLSQAQQAAAKAPSIKSVGTDSLKTGDAPEQVNNDSGFGTHMEYPGHKCATEGCKASFHTPDRLASHTELYHGNPEMLFGN